MAKGFKHGTSGKKENPLNFAVVAYPSEVELNTATPEDTTITTIGVATTNPITGWHFATEQPEDMKEGEVWFFTGTSSTVAFNALKKNGIQVYPLSAKQYVSGAWVDVTAKIYQSGSWAGLILYLFNYGKQSFTWKATNRKSSTSSNWTGVAPSVTTNNDGSVTIKVTKPSSAAHEGSYEMENPYNLSGKTSLTIKYSISHSGSADEGLFELALYSTSPAVGGETIIAKVNLSKRLTETKLEFEGIDECYIAIHTSINGWSGNEVASSASMTFKELIVE